MTTCVSILTPTYNHAPWLAQCVESVLSQTYPHWELVIVDDGSTDRTPEVVAPYLSDGRIRYHRQQNLGIWKLSETYNRALAQSSGELVAILEGDDFWPPDKLASQVRLFADETIGVSYGRVLVADEQGALVSEDILRIQEWQPPYAALQAASQLPFLRDLLLLRGNVGAVSLMFRRRTLEQVGGFHQDQDFPASDFSTLLRVATVARAAFIDKPLGVWRHHSGQTTEIHNLAYVLGHTHATLTYFRNLPEEIKLTLGIGEADIWRARRGYLTDAYWNAARVAMRRREWQDARSYASGMLRWGSPFRKVEGLAAYLAGWLHLDINPWIVRFARTTWGRNLVR